VDALRRLLRDDAPLRPFADAALTGALVVLAAPGTLDGRWPALLAWVAFAPLLFRLPRVSVLRAAALGWLAGLVALLGIST
jgi:apolipoprotein N-acyltransferase